MRRTTIYCALMLLVALAILGNPPESNARNRANKARTCGLQNLRGSYAATYTGTILDVGSYASVAVVTFDGNGNVVGTQHAILNGSPGVFTFEGTYEVGADCTGTITSIHNPGNFEGHFYFAIVGNGKEVLVIQQDQDAVISATFKKQ